MPRPECESASEGCCLIVTWVSCTLDSCGDGRARRLGPESGRDMYFSLDPVDPRRRAKDALKRISKISMLIRRETPTTTLTNFDERLTYGDTDQNLRDNVNYIPRPSHAPCGGGVWGGSRSPCPYHRCRRASSAHSRTHSHSHMLIGTCQAAQPLFGCRAARSRFFTPSPLTSA